MKDKTLRWLYAVSGKEKRHILILTLLQTLHGASGALYAPLLDESTSALDAELEMRLLENLRRMTDKTIVIVTHRSAALSICDRVLRFSESGVQEAPMTDCAVLP